MSSNSDHAPVQMRRDVDLFGAISILAGIMIGSGIFYIGAIVLERSNMSLGLALSVWVIGGIVTMMSGICFAELGTMMPKAGGSYVYLREAYGERTAYMSGITNFLLSCSGSIAGLAVAFAAAVSSLYSLDTIAQKVIALAAIWGLTFINILGIKLGNTISKIFLVLKLMPIILIIACGIFMGSETPDLSFAASSGELPDVGTLIGMVGFAVIATLWAYEGWSNLNNISEEVQNPSRNIPLALIGAIAGVALIYVAFNFAVYRVLPYETITEMVSSGNYYLGTEAANVLFGSAGMWIVGAAMILAIFASLNCCIMVFPRIYYAMARDRALPRRLAELHPTYRTPSFALIASAAVSSVLVMSRSLSELTNLVAIAGIIFYGLTFYSVIILRRKYPNLERPYKVWFYPFLIYAVCAVMIGLAINTIYSDPITALLGFGVPLAGGIYYELVVKKNVVRATEEGAQ